MSVKKDVFNFVKIVYSSIPKLIPGYFGKRYSEMFERSKFAHQYNYMFERV